MVKEKSGIYESAVQKITEWVKPYLHSVTQKFVAKSIEKHAKDNPRYARIIEFEVRRRGDGAGMTQDFAEPLLWTGIKTTAAVAIAAFTHRLKNKDFKLVGDVTVLGILLNNIVELFRLIPRFKAGLQGSLEMAKDRWKSIEEKGIDPFSSQTREITPGAERNAKFAPLLKKPEDGLWVQKISSADIVRTEGVEKSL